MAGVALRLFRLIGPKASQPRDPELCRFCIPRSYFVQSYYKECTAFELHALQNGSRGRLV